MSTIIATHFPPYRELKDHMAGTLPAPSVTDDYAQRVTKDLSENRGEQEHVRAELARLQSDLARLEESEVLLTKMQEVLGGAPKPPTTKKGKSKAAAVPAARSNSETPTVAARGPLRRESRLRWAAGPVPDTVAALLVPAGGRHGRLWSSRAEPSRHRWLTPGPHRKGLSRTPPSR